MLNNLKIALRAGWAEYRRRTSGQTATCYTGVETVLLITAIAGAAISAYGAYEGARQQKEALQAQQRIQEDDAKAAQLAGEAAAARQRAKDRARLESFAAAAGGAGVVAREGSSLLAEMDFAADAELEAQHVKYGYTLDARAKNLRAAEAGRKAGEINPAAAAGISLLSSSGSIAGSYYSGKGASAQTGGGLSTPRSSAELNQRGTAGEDF